MKERKAKKKNAARWVTIGLLAAVLLGGIAGVWFYSTNEILISLELLGDEEVFVEYGQTYEEKSVSLKIRGTHYWKEGIPEQIPVYVSGHVNSERLGKYHLTYRVEYEGQEKEVSRTVWVVDTQAPEIHLILDDGEPAENNRYREEGFTARDNCDGDLTDQVIRIEKEGEIVYSVVDSSGNQSVVHRNVPGFDPVPPDITLEGERTMTIPAGNSFQEPGYTAWDPNLGDLTEQVETEGEVIWYEPGVYEITYRVEDDHGNKASAVRKVTVEGQPWVEPVLPEGKVIYLTFDDGPGPYSHQLLDVLAEYDVKVTFFVVGKGHEELMQRIVDEGHSIAIHSVTHKYQEIYASPEAYFGDILGMQEAIRANTGTFTTLMRFPGGSSNMVSRFNPGIMTTLTKAVQDAGFQYFDWNVDSNDAGGARTWEEVYQNVTEGCANHRVSVVLQHDIHSYSVEAVEEIIRWGKANGYTFLPLAPDSYSAHHGVNN